MGKEAELQWSTHVGKHRLRVTMIHEETLTIRAHTPQHTTCTCTCIDCYVHTQGSIYQDTLDPTKLHVLLLLTLRRSFPLPELPPPMCAWRHRLSLHLLLHPPPLSLMDIHNTHTHTYVRTYIHTYIHTIYIHVHIHTLNSMSENLHAKYSWHNYYTCMYVRTFIYMYMYMHV